MPSRRNKRLAQRKALHEKTKRDFNKVGDVLDWDWMRSRFLLRDGKYKGLPSHVITRIIPFWDKNSKGGVVLGMLVDNLLSMPPDKVITLEVKEGLMSIKPSKRPHPVFSSLPPEKN